MVSAVGERALAACRRSDGRYDLYASRWGGSDRLLCRLLASEDPFARLCAPEWSYRECVSFRTLVETLDYLAVEAVYVLSAAGVLVLRPLWFGLDGVGGPADPSLGALVHVDTVPTLRRMRVGFRTLKDTCRDAIESDSVSITDALRLFLFALPARCWLPAASRVLREIL